MADQNDIHPLVRDLRAAAAQSGITKARLADELGVSERSVAYWLLDDVVPHRKHRRAIRAWINSNAPARADLDGQRASEGERRTA